jgi:ubiquinone/menaquinone biosynthesis C-methylase UbiE
LFKENGRRRGRTGATLHEYRKLAHIYDAATWLPLLPMRLVMLRIAARMGARTVLDDCCGTAAFTAMLDRHGRRAVGLDLSRDMLEQSRRRKRSLLLVEGDATRLPCADDSFDAVFLVFCLHENPHDVQRAMLEEAARVARPDGGAVVCDYRPPDSLLRRVGHLAVNLVERAAGKRHHAMYKEFLARGGMDALLGECGFSHVEGRGMGLGSVGIGLYRRRS